MKTVLAPEVESGRDKVRGGIPGSGPCGMFTLVHPDTGRRLGIIACDGRPDPGMSPDHPATRWEHVSVSVVATYGVCPTWGEMCWVKDQFWNPEEWAVQYHPAKTENINIHHGCLHLWRPKFDTLPVPPKESV